MLKYLSANETEKMFDLVDWKKMLSNADKAADNIDVGFSKKNKAGMKKQFQYIFTVLAQYFDGMRKKLEFFSFVRHRVHHRFHRKFLRPFYESIVSISPEEAVLLEETKVNGTTKETKQEMESKIEAAEGVYSELAKISMKNRVIIKSECFDILKIHKRVKKTLKTLNELNSIHSKYNMSWMEREIYLKIFDETKKIKKRFLLERKKFELLYNKSLDIKVSSVMLFKKYFYDKKMEKYQEKIQRSHSSFDKIKKKVDNVLAEGEQEEKVLLLNEISAQVVEMEKNYSKMEQRQNKAALRDLVLIDHHLLQLKI